MFKMVKVPAFINGEMTHQYELRCEKNQTLALAYPTNNGYKVTVVQPHGERKHEIVLENTLVHNGHKIKR